MQMIPYDPFRYMENLRRDIDKVFTGFPAFLNNEVVGPRVDVYETEKEVVAKCEIPGITKKEDVYIDINNNVLTISGAVHKEKELKDEQFHRRERFAGRFQRNISLPSSVLSEGAEATYKNGILEIRMPKANQASRKRIDINFQ